MNARAWTNGRLWVNDPGSLVARPDLHGCDLWAEHAATYGAPAGSGDRLSELDARGRALTRRLIERSASRAAP